LKDAAPPVWRRIRTPAGVSFDELHDIINETMGWSGYHSFRFYFQDSGESIVDFSNLSPGPELFSEERTAAETRIDDFIRDKETFLYTYDLGIAGNLA
jgi:hypothetical protein